MLHKMKLQNNPYNSILFGSKDIEMRLYDEKRGLINIGDIIEFTNMDTGNTFKVEVINLHRFNSFKDLYNSFNKERLGYKKEEIDKYGVVGIEIKVLNN